MTTKTDVCTGCAQTKIIAARGLCRACYSKWQKASPNGYVRNFTNRVCAVEGCETKQHGQGLCLKHLQRFRRTGTTDEGRKYTQYQKAEGSLIHQHDLYPLWSEFKRARSGRKVAMEWLADFSTFVADVGERPSRRHRLYPIDRTREVGPTNFEWRESLIDKDPNETDQEYVARARLAKKELHGTFYSDGELRKKYGADFGIKELRVMAEAQEHKCKICGEPEREERGGRVRHLAIDHDHATGKVRSLLCTSCNKMLGYAQDKPSRLYAAITYLIKHGTNPAD